MLTVNKLVPQGRGLAAVLIKRATRVALDWDTRSKSRFDATDSAGRTLGVFLPRGSVLRGGDVLLAEDGSLIGAEAAPQPVLVVRPCAEHGSAFDLLRAAYHLGNRHVQLELRPDHLKLEPDHVLADMLRAMHLIVTETEAAFEPEAGAYAQGHAHAHGHGHGHGREHGPAHEQAQALAQEPAHEQAHSPAKGHTHGPGCGHGHGHGHDHTHGH
jgi:urease accessory protein